MKLVLAFFSFFLFLCAEAYNPNRDIDKSSTHTPKELKGLGITERLGNKLDLSLTFKDSQGKLRPLSDFFSSKKPVLMTIIYYECPNLCHLHLDGLVNSFKNLKGLTAGKDFHFVAVSMNHKETSLQALKKKNQLIQKYDRGDVGGHWHFLTGTEGNIQKLASQLGFKFRWDEGTQQYVHAAVAYSLTSEGVLSRYLYGLEWTPKDLKFALTETGNGQIGTLIDQLILFCFQFDPSKSQYTLYAYNLMKLGGVLTLIILAIFLGPFWWKQAHLRERV